MLSRVVMNALKAYRLARTLTQEQLGQLVGLSQETISQAETGAVTLQPGVRVRLAAILGATEKDLFPETEPVNG